MIVVAWDSDTVVFKEYWNDPAKTKSASIACPNGATWHLTGDLGYRDNDGYFWFRARVDDLIITASYRVGSGEVKSTILEHPEVEQVGVVGIPDAERGKIIKSFVRPTKESINKEEVRAEIENLVRNRLAEYEYPQENDFVDSLPTTTTGTIQRRKLRNSE